MNPSPMDLGIFWTVIGTSIATILSIIGITYTFLRNFKSDIGDKFKHMENRLDAQDERIFLLATGKSLKEAMIESKKAIDSRKEG